MPDSPARPTELPPIFAFTAANTFAAGLALVGVFFVTRSALGFTSLGNYGLGVVIGVAYLLGAIRAGRWQRWLRARRPELSQRRLLGLMTVALALLCLLPWALRSSISVYVFVALYSPITGSFWPLIQSFMSGGRRGPELRRAVGRFNVVWSAAITIGMVVEGAFLEHAPFGLFLLLSAAHLASLLALRSFQPEPAEARGEDHLVPESYPALLRAHRWLLAMGYLVMYTLAPYLPRLTDELAIPRGWQAPAAATWMLARVCTFEVLQRWQGWHGRFATALVGAGALGLGFTASVLSPRLATGDWTIFLVGLLLYGSGAAVLYTAALYYALEVGSAGPRAGLVEAGGSHEALIGLGYTLGPLCGLAALGAARLGWIPASGQDAALLALVGVLCTGAFLRAVRARPRAGCAASRGGIPKGAAAPEADTGTPS